MSFIIQLLSRLLWKDLHSCCSRLFWASILLVHSLLTDVWIGAVLCRLPYINIFQYLVSNVSFQTLTFRSTMSDVRLYTSIVQNIHVQYELPHIISTVMMSSVDISVLVSEASCHTLSFSEVWSPMWTSLKY